jgi:hypothetical protein
MIPILTVLIALLIDATPQKMGEEEQKRLAKLKARLEGRIHPERGVPIAIWEDGAMLARIVDPKQGTYLIDKNRESVKGTASSGWGGFDVLTQNNGVLLTYINEKSQITLLLVLEEDNQQETFTIISSSELANINAKDKRRVLSYLIESGIHDCLEYYGPDECDLLDDVILVEDETLDMLKAAHKLSLKANKDIDRWIIWEDWLLRHGLTVGRVSSTETRRGGYPAALTYLFEEFFQLESAKEDFYNWDGKTKIKGEPTPEEDYNFTQEISHLWQGSMKFPSAIDRELDLANDLILNKRFCEYEHAFRRDAKEYNIIPGFSVIVDADEPNWFVQEMEDAHQRGDIVDSNAIGVLPSLYNMGYLSTFNIEVQKTEKPAWTMRVLPQTEELIKDDIKPAVLRPYKEFIQTASKNGLIPAPLAKKLLTNLDWLS